MLNYIEDVNRFDLPTPPEWFLKRLWDFDAELVLIPSQREVVGVPAAYLLCRRRLYSLSMSDTVMFDNKNPDTNMCHVHKLLPIGPLRFNNGCSTFTEAACDSLLKDLAARDMWAVTGRDKDPDAAWKLVEDNEQATKDKERRNLREHFYHLGRDAYRSLKARTGQRNKRATDVTQPQSAQRVTLTDAL